MKKIYLLLLLILSMSIFAKELQYSNLSYGTHARQIFDLWLPKKNNKAPLIIYIHGGGFVSGDKSNIHKQLGLINKYTNSGFAVASINYRFLEHTSLQNIMTEDIAGFVQFIRFNARKFNINPKKIMSMGSSAGGSASLWLGTHPDIKIKKAKNKILRESSRITAFAHINAQAGYDFIDWFDYFGYDLTNNFMQSQIWSRYHLTSVDDLYTADGVEIRSQLDSVENMTSDDAAMYLYNSYESKDINTADYDYYIHGPHHANILLKRAQEVGLTRKSVIKSNGAKMPNLTSDILQFFQTQI